MCIVTYMNSTAPATFTATETLNRIREGRSMSYTVTISQRWDELTDRQRDDINGRINHVASGGDVDPEVVYPDADGVYRSKREW